MCFIQMIGHVFFPIATESIFVLFGEEEEITGYPGDFKERRDND